MNWDQRIAKAEKNGYFTDTDKMISGNWTRCSIGERFKIKSVEDARLKVDSDLVKLGVEFCECICKDRISRAKRLHNKIKKLAK